MKFSLIVPVYNVEKYVLKCLQSIDSQTYQNYEVIIVNDGSIDNSDAIIKKFIKDKKNFKYYKKKNGGLSDARNYGLKYVTGDYLIFIDSDDTINKDLLENLNNKLKEEKVDVVRFGLNIVNENEQTLRIINNAKESIDKYKTLKSIVNTGMIEAAWLYCYNYKFWNKNNFKYTYGTIHEDYGLTLIVLSKCKKISCIDYKGYNYIVRDNSIMTQTTEEKLYKRTMDFKYHFENHRKLIKPNCRENKLLLGYSAEALINKSQELKDENLNEMLKYLKEQKVVDQIYAYSFRKLLKKIYLKIFLKKYLLKISNNFYKGLKGENND